MKKMLGIDSNHDNITNILLNFRNIHVYPRFQVNFDQCELKQGNQATRSEVANVAKDSEIKYITGSGHGFYNTFEGQDGEIIWRKRCPLLGGPAYDREEVEDKIIHLVSCGSADVLGPDMVKKGCLAFFGYAEDFWVTDQTGQLSMYVDSQIDKAVSEGKNAEEVYNLTVIASRIAESHLAQNGLVDYASEIQHNLDWLRCPHHGVEWGDKTSRIIFDGS